MIPWTVGAALLAAFAAPATYIFPAPSLCQQTESWCWAAVTEMTVAGLAREGVSLPAAESQCDQGTTLGGTRGGATQWYCKCDSNLPILSDAVVTGWPRYAEHGLSCEATADRTWLTFEDLVAELAAHRPVAFSWHYTADTGHIMLAVGAFITQQQRQVVVVNDPLPICSVTDGCGPGTVCQMSYETYKRLPTNNGRWVHYHWIDFHKIAKPTTGTAACATPPLGVGKGPPPHPGFTAPFGSSDKARARTWVLDYLGGGGTEGRKSLGLASFHPPAVGIGPEVLAVRFIDPADLGTLADADGPVWQRPVDGWNYLVSGGQQTNLVAEEYSQGSNVLAGTLCRAELKAQSMKKARELSGDHATGAVERVVVPALNLEMLSYRANDSQGRDTRYFVIMSNHPGFAPAAYVNGDEAVDVVPRIQSMLATRGKGPG